MVVIRKVLSEPTYQNFCGQVLEYYATEALVEMGKNKIRDWLIRTLVPGAGTPVFNYMGHPAIKLGTRYRAELQREGDELLAELPGLGLTPEEMAAYRSDLLARQTTNNLIALQVDSQRNFLWHMYQAALDDEAEWWKFWAPLLGKWAVLGLATLTWDGPGYYVASTGLKAYDTIYDALWDTYAIKQDEKMLDQSLRFLEGRTSLAYAQIALNTVNGLNLIRAGDPPQIAGGSVGTLTMKSFGHYRFWPYFHWSEEESQIELPVANHAGQFDTSYLTSASYGHTTHKVIFEQLLIEGEALDLSGGDYGIAVIKFKSRDWGLSPDEGSIMGILVLGATETGIYPVAYLVENWNPDRVEQRAMLLAKTPAEYTSAEAAEAPTLAYPLSSVIATSPGSTDHQVAVAVINPFTLTVSATVTHTIPANFEILDNGGGQVVGNALVWRNDLEPGAGLELRALLRWEGAPGESATLPGPELAFQDPNTNQGDTYTAPDETVPAAWPLEVSVDIPMTWQSGVTVIIPVTLTNLSTSVTAQGIFTGTVSTLDGTLLWWATSPVNIAPGETESLSLPVRIITKANYVIVQGEVTLSTVSRNVFQEMVAIEHYRVYLPLVLHNR